ncbi:acylneuraminate cytidylyltransferase family protein [SAR86 cluster bacterium]|nr:acylneuraminate cytidylyltransferase family protein [SAR86 cluster bacterium]
MKNYKKKFYILIPARAGSKGIKKKNIQNFRDKPLIEWTLSSAKKVKNIEKIVLSTNMPELNSYSSDKNIFFLRRPEQYCSDSATMNSVIKHASHYFDDEEIVWILLQPTSPLRTEVHIEDCIELFKSSPDDSLIISVLETSSSHLKAFYLNETGNLSGAFNNNAPFQNRQELPKCYMPNGAIYIFSDKSFRKFSKIPNEEIIPYIMNDASSKDIDTINDLKS